MKRSAIETTGLMSSMKSTSVCGNSLPTLNGLKLSASLVRTRSFVDGLEALEGKSDLLKLFEKFPGASLCHSFYDHGSPGCSGFYLEAFVKRRHLDYVQNAFTALLKAIDSQLEQLKNLPKGQ